ERRSPDRGGRDGICRDGSRYVAASRSRPQLRMCPVKVVVSPRNQLYLLKPVRRDPGGLLPCATRIPRLAGGGPLSRQIEARWPQVPWLRAVAHPGNFKISPRGNPTAVASRNRAAAE